jgi:hypothetical protein
MHYLNITINTMKFSIDAMRIVQSLYILLIAFLVVPVYGIIRGIKDDSAVYPYVYDAITSKRIEWGKGRIAELVGKSIAIRVSDRGIRFIQRGNAIHDLRARGWMNTTCTLGHNYLCLMSTGDKVFPITKAHIPQSHDYVVNPVTSMTGSTVCRFHSNRLIANVSTYDISLCDIIDNSYDIVWTNSTIFVRKNATPIYMYVLITVFTIVLVTCVAQNIAFSFGDDEAHISTLMSVVSSLALFITVCTEYRNGHGYITEVDYMFFWTTIGYLALNIVTWVSRMIYSRTYAVEAGVPFNLLLANILLTICKLYDGIENEYVLPVLFLMGTRSAYKTFDIFALTMMSIPATHLTTQAETTQSNKAKVVSEEIETLRFNDKWLLWTQPEALVILHQATTFIDWLYIAFTFQVGVRPMSSVPHEADIYFVMVMITSMCVALLIWRQ